MSGFPPPLPNGGLFNRLPNPPPILRGFPVPLLPLIPPPPQLSGVTVPAGISSISVPPIRHPLLTSNPIIGPPPSLFPAPPIIPGLPTTLPLNFPQLKPIIPQIKLVKGPSITVFVGNITERAPDKLIQQILSKCGSVNSWKRIQGPDGKWQGFGFCEFSEPEAAVRAIRVLHDYEICDKKFVVKVDAKTQEKLDSYFNKNKKSDDKDDKKDGMKDDKKEEKIDFDTVNKDKEDSEKNKNDEHKIDEPESDHKKAEEVEDDKEQVVVKEGANGEEVKLPSEKDDEQEVRPPKPAVPVLTLRPVEPQDIELRRAIQKLLEDNESVLSQDPELKYLKRKQDNRENKKEEVDDKDLTDMNLDTEQQNIIHREIGKFRDTYRKDDDKDDSNKREVKDKVRRKLREENRQRRERRESPHYRRNASPVDHFEEVERRKDLELVAKKEANYQKRLREWIRREERKERQFKKEKEEELREKEEDTDERVKLLKFLQDYNDDRDDLKHYKGRVFQKRLSDRQKEMQEDELDKADEERELKAVKAGLKETDPDLVDGRSKSQGGDSQDDEEPKNSGSKRSAENGNSEAKKLCFVGMKLSGAQEQSLSAISLNVGNSASTSTGNKKKLVMSDIFNANEDEQRPTKRPRLPPPSVFLEDNADSNLSSGSKGNQISHEDKKKMIKTLIDGIPATKEELFAATIGWEYLDEALMKKRIRPWINKKISEYIGDDEPELLEFICSKLASKTSAQSLLDDVTMVLDDEAQVFVVKLWRLLIYEIEAKKMGISK